MKHTLFILALITASIQTFAQSPRIKLNQITKDSLTGSVLISSPTDSGMVYSRDLFISYGADTVLILGADTLAATSGIISSVLSDGVTITGDGTTGSELTVDTATVIATKGDLNNINLASQVTGTLPIANGGTGATSFTAGRVLFGNGTSAINTDGDLFWDNSNKRLGIGTITPFYKIDIKGGNASTLRLDNDNSQYVQMLFERNSVTNSGGDILLDGVNETFGVRTLAVHSFTFSTSSSIGTPNERMRITPSGNVGIGTPSPSQKLEVNGKVKISDLTGTGGNAVYENGGVLGVASDSRFKNYIGDIDNGIQKVLNLKPKYFVDNRNSTFQQLGFYAQEVKSVINEASYPIGNTDYLGINDRAIIAVTVKAIQEQQAIIESQASEIQTLKTLITELSNRLTILENN